MAEAKQTTEATGVDVEAAIATGLKDLGVDRDAVEIEVLNEGSRGVFGLGAREARVRLTVVSRPTPATPQPEPAPAPIAQPAAPTPTEKSEAEIARRVLSDILALMDLKGARADLRRADPASGEREPLILDVHGPGTDVLIGRRGQTLAALQHIVRLIVSQETARHSNLVVDIEGFKTRREKTLRSLAQRMAEQAVRTNRTVALEPMPPHERRIVHLALRGHPSVTTESVGEGERRKVTIIPR